MMNILIVGAGLFGSVVAHELAQNGHHVTIVEKRDHIAGNIYTKEIAGIQVHQYGAHIFHTSNQEIWKYVQQFAEFNRYTNMPIANYRGELYNLPFNMNTFNRLWGVVTPDEAKAKIDEQRVHLRNKKPANLEEQAISLVGTDIYERLIKGYTQKQWGRPCTQLPAFIIRRLPVRFTYDNNYFDDLYQGIPIGGYTKMIENMLDHSNIKVELNTDFFAQKAELEAAADHIIFSGMIDQYFDYRYGPLAYRSLRFEHDIVGCENVQGNAVVNYTDSSVPYTRIIEHKHFEFGTQRQSVLTKEYPLEWTPGQEAYYPVNDQDNTVRFKQYFDLTKEQTHVTFGGRLGLYRYCDMDQIIHQALHCARKFK